MHNLQYLMIAYSVYTIEKELEDVHPVTLTNFRYPLPPSSSSLDRLVFPSLSTSSSSSLSLPRSLEGTLIEATVDTIVSLRIHTKYHECTVGQNNQEYRLKYCAIRSSAHLFLRTAHSFACSALLASLARSAALTRLLARSLPRSWESE